MYANPSASALRSGAVSALRSGLGMKRKSEQDHKEQKAKRLRRPSVSKIVLTSLEEQLERIPCSNVDEERKRKIAIEYLSSPERSSVEIDRVASWAAAQRHSVHVRNLHMLVEANFPEGRGVWVEWSMCEQDLHPIILFTEKHSSSRAYDSGVGWLVALTGKKKVNALILTRPQTALATLDETRRGEWIAQTVKVEYVQPVVGSSPDLLPISDAAVYRRSEDPEWEAKPGQDPELALFPGLHAWVQLRKDGKEHLVTAVSIEYEGLYGAKDLTLNTIVQVRPSQAVPKTLWGLWQVPLDDIARLVHADDIRKQMDQSILARLFSRHLLCFLVEFIVPVPTPTPTPTA